MRKNLSGTKVGVFQMSLFLAHRAEFRDTSGTFSIACSTKLEIVGQKTQNNKAKWPKPSQHRLLVAFFDSIQHTNRLGTLGLLKKRH